MYNPSLREQPRSARAPIIPIQQESSILDWLEATGRLLAREAHDFDYSDNEEEIAELMAVDDGSYDIDDDDEDLLDLDE
jgi:hypothetical protein